MRIRLYGLLFFFLSGILCQSSLAITASEEQKYGREIHSEITKGAKLNSDFLIGLYAEEIKRKLEQVSSPPYPLKLTVIESRNADAFATMGGYIYVTTGLIELCETVEEFAGVLAHEISHLTRRHVVKRLEKEKYLNIGRMATLVLAMLLGDPKAKEAVITSGMGAIQSVSLMYSREDEEEADATGILILEKANFGCTGISDFLKRLRLTSKDVSLPQYLLTHPYHEERISRLEVMCKKREKQEEREDLFQYVVKRAEILNRQSKAELLNHYLKKYAEDKNDTASAYGASLLMAKAGKKDEALGIAKSLDSRFSNLFLGEILFLSRNYWETVEILKGTDSPYELYILARSFEETGDVEKAESLYRRLLPFAESYPEIYLRLGMASGRSGKHATGFEYLGRYYLALGKDAEGKMYLEKAISKYGPNSDEARNLMSILDILEKR